MSVKQVIIVRKDLQMRKGKMVAQGAHASLMAVLSNQGEPDVQVGNSGEWLLLNLDDSLREWLDGDFKKICVGVHSEAELLTIHQSAIDQKLRCSLVQDLGLTEFGGVPTYTSVAIGPEDAASVDAITGGLSLL